VKKHFFVVAKHLSRKNAGATNSQQGQIIIIQQEIAIV